MTFFVNNCVPQSSGTHQKSTLDTEYKVFSRLKSDKSKCLNYKSISLNIIHYLFMVPYTQS